MPLLTNAKTRLGPWGVSRAPDGPYTGKSETVDFVPRGASAVRIYLHQAGVRVEQADMHVETVGLTVSLPERIT